MSLNLVSFRADLLSTFSQSNESLLASSLEQAVLKFINTGTFSTTDVGVGTSAGAYTGASSKVGGFTLSPGMAAEFQSTWKYFKVVKEGEPPSAVYHFSDPAMSPLSAGSSLFSKYLAETITNHILAGTLTTTTTGTLVTTHSSTPASAQATGKLVPGAITPEIMAQQLLASCQTLAGPPAQGSPNVLVEAIVNSVYSYLLACTLNITFSSALIVGTGTGKLV